MHGHMLSLGLNQGRQVQEQLADRVYDGVLEEH